MTKFIDKSNVNSGSWVVNYKEVLERNTRYSTTLKAFTLVELSVVITIMGLLAAATLAGSELLNISKVKSVISEIESYKVAVDNFKTQYGALPGDLKNATDFWTTAQNGGSIAVQNGNGDGQIGDGSLDYGEAYYLWNHLTLSQFVPGTFSGSSATGASVGVNMPASKYMDNIGYGINYFTNPWGYVDTLNRGFSANYVWVGKSRSSTIFPGTAAFLGSQAHYIDSKIDDGTPDFGKVLAGPVATCTSGSAPNRVYVVTSTTAVCFLAINID